MWRQVSPVIREQFLQLNEVRFIMLNEFVRPGDGALRFFLGQFFHTFRPKKPLFGHGNYSVRNGVPCTRYIMCM